MRKSADRATSLPRVASLALIRDRDNKGEEWEERGRGSD